MRKIGAVSNCAKRLDFQSLSTGSLARALALPGTLHGLSITGVVAIQVTIIMCKAAPRSKAGIGALTIPLVEPEPILGCQWHDRSGRNRKISGCVDRYRSSELI